MDFEEVVRRRRMVRSYEDAPVAADVLDGILEAARRAPSAGFTQGVDLLILVDPDDRRLFWSHVSPDPSAGGRWDRLRHAPVVVLPLADKAAYLARYSEPDKAGLGLEREDAWSVPFWDIDAAFATMAMLLAATAAGLGALFFGIAHGEEGLLRDLGVPAGIRPVGALTMGWPAPDPPSPSLARGRRPRDQQVHFGRWHRP